MSLRGEVYIPRAALPPGQATTHRCVILSNNFLIGQHGGRNLFVNVALIRSAVSQSGRPVSLVPGHSFRVTPKDLPFLSHESIIETHQIFAVPIQDFLGRAAQGNFPPVLLQKVLEGARRLFT